MNRLVCCCVLALLGVACGAPEPPRYVSLDNEFSIGERESIRAAIDDWCDAVGWCPEEQGWTERGRFVLVDDLPESDFTERVCPPGKTCKTSAHNDGDNIEIARNRPRSDSLDALWTIAAHEVGHYCLPGEHTKNGLMAAAHAPADVLEIDETAVSAWKDGCR